MTAAPLPEPVPVQRLSRDELSELVDVMLRVGEAMLESGAAGQRTEQTMARSVSASARTRRYTSRDRIIATAVSGHEQRTRVGRAVRPAWTWARSSPSTTSRAISRCSAGRCPPSASSLPPSTTPARAAPPGLRSGGRRRLRGLRPILGGGTVEFVAAGVGAALAQGVRLLLARLRVNAFALTVVFSFVASLVARDLPAPRRATRSRRWPLRSC